MSGCVSLFDGGLRKTNEDTEKERKRKTHSKSISLHLLLLVTRRYCRQEENFYPSVVRHFCRFMITDCYFLSRCDVALLS
jgi:hypothetical protein